VRVVHGDILGTGGHAARVERVEEADDVDLGVEEQDADSKEVGGVHDCRQFNSTQTHSCR
jgi:hypothetical protein